MDSKSNQNNSIKKKSRFVSDGLTVKLKKTRGKSTSQQRWLTRQLNDPYVRAAQQQGWRSRAAFKLIELDQKFHIFKPNMKVIDLGAAPGGWSQVAKSLKAKQVVGIDLLAIEPMTDVEFIQGDFTDVSNSKLLISKLKGKADVVLSDMAPNTTGHSGTDHIRIMNLTEEAIYFAARILNPGGIFVAKVFQGGTEKELLIRLKQMFSIVKHAKPPASRKESKELYVVAMGFRPSEISLSNK
ncbi:Ribosomal RNA large subunit methyltransferase E [Commensalibacter sp. Nvir]|uniref:RlmE family RNA methyltransferase n=1 Tax=Commensalibacter sp. Nvir TaxID=3069817 RepID=UPI002D58B2C4|nr:Ribosomal RNA large subunit methyltransferase E [Commensalibacter sp. Nvir]